jgi:hypothetical protein
VNEDNTSIFSETTQPDVTENSPTNDMIVAQQTENLATPDHMLHQANTVDEEYLAERAIHGTDWITQIVDRAMEEIPSTTNTRTYTAASPPS